MWGRSGRRENTLGARFGSSLHSTDAPFCLCCPGRIPSVVRELSIAIATRNRWQTLHATLERLARSFPTIAVTVVDDGSDRACPYDPTALHPALTFEVRTSRAGRIVRRNQLMAQAETPYVLGLEDDAYPADGSLEHAVNALANDPHAYSASLAVFNPRFGEYRNPPRYGAPSPCQAYSSCGHILKRDTFLSLGGYTELLVERGEARDLSARALQQGWHALHFSGCLIHHTESAEGRDFARMDYYRARNAVLWNDWYVPSESQLHSRLRCVRTTLGHTLRSGRLDHLKGYQAGTQARESLSQLRVRMSTKQYARWQALPHA